MDSVRTVGIVIGVANYRESDKLITLWTGDYGKVNAMLKGVRKSNAKLKAFGQPLCFGNFELVKSAVGYTVTGCEMIESFFDLANDYERFEVALKMAKDCASATQFGQPNSAILILLVKMLKVLLTKSANVDIAYIKFLLEFFAALGFRQSTGTRCAQCAKEIKTERKLDTNAGGVVCAACASAYALHLDRFCHTAIRLIDECDISQLESIRIEHSLLDAKAILLASLHGNE